jgi:hypothetical protein
MEYVFPAPEGPMRRILGPGTVLLASMESLLIGVEKSQRDLFLVVVSVGSPLPAGFVKGDAGKQIFVVEIVLPKGNNSEIFPPVVELIPVDVVHAEPNRNFWNQNPVE